MRRRRVLALGAAAIGFSGCTRNDAEGATLGPTRTLEETATVTEDAEPREESTSIGGSLHGRPHRLLDDLDLIERSETNWLHAFLDVRKKHERDVEPEEDPDVAALRRIARQTEVKLLVSLKWNFTGNFGEVEPEPLPSPGSARERELIEYAVELLEAVGEPVDALVLGNEPIWETPEEDVVGPDAGLVPFTREVKRHVVDHYTGGDPRLLLGAFNRLYDEYVWNDFEGFYRQLFDWAREDDDIEGIDLHVHYSTFERARTMLELARREIPDGTIVATEFSPVFRYDLYKDEPVASFAGGERFAERYGISGDTTVTEYLEAAKDDRLSRREVADFYETMPWYNVNFVEDMSDLLSRYGVEVGTFGFLMGRDVRHVDWTEGWTPFPINCLFQPGIIDTEDGAHPHYLDDFRRRA